MEASPASIREELVADLVRLVGVGEEISLRLKQRYPQLLSQLQSGIGHCDEQARTLQHDGRDRSGQPDAFILTEITTILRTVSDAGESFERVHETDKQLFEQLDSGIEHLSELEGRIAEIKEDSIEMELVSLNAMTMALKAGHAGLAFSYITEELKRLSAQTIELTDDITRRGERLRRAFGEFSASLSETRRFQDELFIGFRDKLSSGFEDLRRSIVSTAEAVAATCRNSRDVETPLRAIVDELQQRDFVKPSLEQVIATLQEAGAVARSYSNEAVLDELAFLKRLAGLCTTVLDDIRDDITTRLRTLREQSTRAKNRISALDDQRDRLVKARLRDDTPESLPAAFGRASSLLETLVADLDSSLKKKQHIAERSGSLMKDVRELEQNLRSFSKLIARFHSIDIASRIEVSKQTVLQRMSGTVEQMTVLTEKIDADVDSALEITKNFISTVSRTLGDFQSAAHEEERFALEFSQSMQRHHQALQSAQNHVLYSLAGFSPFSADFMALFAQTGPELDQAHRLVDELMEIKQKLPSIIISTEQRMQPLLYQLRSAQWNISNERLQQLVQRLTLVTRRQHAGEVTPA